MKLYLYRGLDNEQVPKDVTHVIVDNSVTVIKKEAFSNCIHLVSLIMVDNVKRIQEYAFWNCLALRFIRLSKALEFIGEYAFWCCHSLEVMFLSSTVQSIITCSFAKCESLKLLILPNGINLCNLGDAIIRDTAISHMAENAGAKYFDEDDGEDEEYIQWAKGVGAKNGASGKVYVNTNESGSEVIYKVNFNSTHANIKSGGSSVCSSLADNLMTTFVYGYNLYNATTGALIDIAAGVEIVYGTDKDKRGYVGSYWDESAGAIKLWMHTEDGFKPDIIYRKSDLGVAITVNSWSGRTPTISAMTFVAPIQFTDSFTASTPAGVSDTRDNDLVYEGPGQLWGIPWSNSSGSWQPSYNLADGDTLIGRNGDYAGVSYKVKRTGAWKTLATISGSSDIATHCTTPLPVTDAAFSALTTAPTLTAVSETWASKPAVTAAVKVIHGVLQ